MAWAAQAGLSVKRRPKKLTGELRRQAMAELKNGADKSEVARNADVSIVTITKLLLSEVGLHAAWCQSRRTQAQASARQAWTHLLQAHPRLGVKLMRAMDPGTYAWLYRNDRAWLEGHKPHRQAIETTPGLPRVLWDVRDQALSADVDRAVLELRKHVGTCQLRLWQIFQALPSLKAKLAALDRLSELSAFFEALHLLQRAVTRLAAQRWTDEDLNDIRRCAQAYADHAEDSDFRKTLERDQAIHLRIAEASRNPHLQGLYQRLLAMQMRLLLPHALSHGGQDPELADQGQSRVMEHKELIDALTMRDADTAERLAGEHTRIIRKRVAGFSSGELNMTVS